MEFRYRYVDYGTAFRFGAGDRPLSGAPHSKDDETVLHENEVAVDVGGVCWCYEDQPLAVIDHHFARPGQYPSATAAVLHYATLLRRKFSHSSAVCVWLVTHRHPDFDALCSTYMVRSVLEDPECGDPAAWSAFGIDQAGVDRVGAGRLDWFHPNLSRVPAHHRWRVLLAAYASSVDNCLRLACPPDRALHSVLYAALQRGRDYTAATSGALELFDAARQAIQRHGRNPLFDSVLEGNPAFEPELALLGREAEAYRRDLRRARKVIVFVPRAEHSFDRWFTAGVKKQPLLDAAGNVNPDHLTVPGKVRVQMDGIYLRDPECLLFKEWARLDTENSSLGLGFTFTAVVYSSGRPAAAVNQSDYYFALDPEMSRGSNLYALWAKLEAAEVRAIHAPANTEIRLALEAAEARAASSPGRGTVCREHFEERAAAAKACFDDPWFDGQNYRCTIVPTPNRGTYIGPAGTRADLLDDPVVALVREELESSLYVTPVVICDLPARAGAQETAHPPAGIQHSAPLPVPGCFRLAMVQLDGGVKLADGRLASQIGAALWRLLSPDFDGLPAAFVTEHLSVGADWVGVWNRRGIALACRQDPSREVPREAMEISAQFRQLVDLTREAEAFLEQAARRRVTPASGADSPKAEDLLRREAVLRHSLALPESRLLCRFFEAIQIGYALRTLRDVNREAELDRQTGEFARNTGIIADVQAKVEWLEAFFVGVYFTELTKTVVDVIEGRNSVALWAVPGVGILALVVALLLLRPWDHGPHS